MSESHKKMNVFQLTVITLVNMMGSGIILLPSKLAEIGTITIFSWLFTAGGSLALAYVFARCGFLSRKPGGMGGYAEYAFGKGGNYMANYTYGLSLVIGNVAIGVTAVGYATVLFGATLSPMQTCFWTIVLLWITTFANFGGASITGKIGTVTVWGVILPVVLICLIGWFWFSPSTWSAAWNPHDMGFWAAVGSSISVTLWAFLGLESACANADAVENPEKNVPIAVLVATIGAAVVYIVSTNVIAGIIPNAELAKSSAPFGLAYSHMFSPGIGQTVTALMVIACIGSLLGWQFTVAQVFKSSADVGYFVPIFSRVTKIGTPIVGMLVLLAVQTALALMTASPELSETFGKVVNLAVVTNLVPYVMSMAAIVTIQNVSNIPKDKARLTNFVALIATVYSFYALYSSGTEAIVLGGLCIFLGWTLFGFFAANRFYRMENEAHVPNPGKSFQT
ncbi:putrescine-ornithine antiporter [Lysobacter sp. TAF61]|uniref:putrescine-ornithine antiporter n=1 Tax=Lysobacter sp. TAF61 TaxID=3233072 RepID=UPI003F995711